MSVEKTVMEKLQEKKTANVKDIVKETGLNRNSVGYVLSKAAKAGNVRRTKRGEYEIL